MVKTIEIVVKRLSCKKTEIVFEKDGIFYINVRGVSEANKSNLEIVKFFTRKYKSPVKIVKGLKSKKKLILLE